MLGSLKSFSCALLRDPVPFMHIQDLWFENLDSNPKNRSRETYTLFLDTLNYLLTLSNFSGIFVFVEITSHHSSCLLLKVCTLTASPASFTCAVLSTFNVHCKLSATWCFQPRTRVTAWVINFSMYFEKNQQSQLTHDADLVKHQKI